MDGNVSAFQEAQVLQVLTWAACKGQKLRVKSTHAIFSSERRRADNGKDLPYRLQPVPRQSGEVHWV